MTILHFAGIMLAFLLVAAMGYIGWSNFYDAHDHLLQACHVLLTHHLTSKGC